MAVGPKPGPVAIVLAGGQGTRIRHLLPDLPKPLAPVAGRPFLEWILRFLRGQGLRQFVLSTGHQAQKVAAFAKELKLEGASISCVEEHEALGTAGGFLNALRAVPAGAAELMVCNGDSLVLAELGPLLASLDSPEVDGALLAVCMEDASRYGTVVTENDASLRGFLEKRPGAGLVNGGVYLFRRSTLGLFPGRTPLSFEYDVFPALVTSGARVRVVPCTGAFLDIGTEASLAQATSFVENNMRWFA